MTVKIVGTTAAEVTEQILATGRKLVDWRIYPSKRQLAWVGVPRTTYFVVDLLADTIFFRPDKSTGKDAPRAGSMAIDLNSGEPTNYTMLPLTTMRNQGPVLDWPEGCKFVTPDAARLVLAKLQQHDRALLATKFPVPHRKLKVVNNGQLETHLAVIKRVLGD